MIPDPRMGHFWPGNPIFRSGFQKFVIFPPLSRHFPVILPSFFRHLLTEQWRTNGGKMTAKWRENGGKITGKWKQHHQSVTSPSHGFQKFVIFPPLFRHFPVILPSFFRHFLTEQWRTNGGKMTAKWRENGGKITEKWLECMQGMNVTPSTNPPKIGSRNTVAPPPTWAMLTRKMNLVPRLPPCHQCIPKPW